MADLRREFQLPPSDVQFLDARGYRWEAVRDATANWLLLHDFSIPVGYGHSETTVALRVEPAYPDVQIDMAYFDPPLSRKDGKSIAALSTQQIEGRQFQRWSRHRTKENPWRPGVDDVSTHLGQVESWLERELKK